MVTSIYVNRGYIQNNKITLPGEAEITAFRPEMRPFLPASYTAINAGFGFLYGSI
jgi:hypothetical protein